MVIDTSAILAILQDEPERRAFNETIEAAPSLSLSVANLVESSIVVEARFGPAGVLALDRFLETAGVSAVPVDREQGELARRAYREYGKGRHRAGLNFGDCFAYALAIARAEPLLCKGDDFAQTDVMVARPDGRAGTAGDTGPG
jgi:ribonuclease VapC